MATLSRDKILALCLFEGLNLLADNSLVAEQDNTQSQLPGVGAMPPQQQAPQTNMANQASDPTTGEALPTGVDGQPLTIDSLIERMNVIRGGKSFSDPEVYGQLTTMFKALPDEEKLTIDRVLLDISKVVINANPQNPEDNGGNVNNGTVPPPPANMSGIGQQPNMGALTAPSQAQQAASQPAGGISQ